MVSCKQTTNPSALATSGIIGGQGQRPSSPDQRPCPTAKDKDHRCGVLCSRVRRALTIRRHWVRTPNSRPLEIRSNLTGAYPDVLTPAAIDVMSALAPLDDARRDV